MQITAGSAIDDLGGTSAVADELGVPPNTVSTWRGRGIPPHRWPALVRLAGAKGCSHITFEALADLAAREPAEARV